MSFSLDHLSSVEFEEFCADLLVDAGFYGLSWRRGTGLASSPADQGRDIECRKYSRDDLDNSGYEEKWFVECKHHRQGVPPERLNSALAWASAERPDHLLIIASNFLSNPAKNFLETYQQRNVPPFRIRVWERPDLERIVVGRARLIAKYRLSMPMQSTPFDVVRCSDPLYLDGISRSISYALTTSPQIPLFGMKPFDGNGLYAIHYHGNKQLYDSVDVDYEQDALRENPIYVGKAVSALDAPLNFRSAFYSSALYRRLMGHAHSIEAATNLNLDDFSCQYVVMADVWAMLAEPYLRSVFNPLWNKSIQGFALHDPGAGRYSGRKSAWDILHPGRKWAEKLRA
ncbi:Eco29kI family restriction endonuclease [Paraburkholderia caledonica]|uniref:Eco29kI family restriction endonuclease n=1 Tax=Paraburkholderia caledonica TaxID=134536 RepID=UPI000B403DFC|nr:Eco29kI family restriction endonuclease [Paraburkholderia caledonica]